MTNGQSGTNGAPAKRRRRLLIGLLAVSLAFNLFVIGWAGVRWAAWGWGSYQFGGMVSRDHRDADGGDGSRWGLLQDLAREHGPAALSMAAAGVPRLREAADALEQDPFNPARFEAAMNAVEETGYGLVGLAGVAVRDGAGRLTAEERGGMARRVHRAAESLERRLGRWEDLLLRLPE